MSDLLERLIQESMSAPLPGAMPRDVRPLMLPRKADVFVGMRRSGKTFAMFDTMQRMAAEGVARERMLYLNLDDDRIVAPDLAFLGEALETFYRLAPRARETGSYLFFDEIQVVDQWERFARRVLDTENAQLFVGGSSSKLLSMEVATTFRGRGFTTEVLPYGFREFARAHGREPLGAVSYTRATELEALADRYLAEGGFPETIDMTPMVRAQTLQGYVETVAMRDVIERHGVQNVAALRRLIGGVFSANAGQFSVSSFVGTLRSQGFKTTKVTLMSYLDHLADAFLFFLVSIDSRSEKTRMVNPRKVYAVDPGLALAMYSGGSVNRGALLENAVYLELRRRLGPLGGSSIAYHRTASGREIDFVVDAPDSDVREFYQVCWSLGEPGAQERETVSIAETLQANPGSSATIITRLESGELQTSAGNARIVPFWQWALEKGVARDAGIKAP